MPASNGSPPPSRLCATLSLAITPATFTKAHTYGVPTHVAAEQGSLALVRFGLRPNWPLRTLAAALSHGSVGAARGIRTRDPLITNEVR